MDLLALSLTESNPGTEIAIVQGCTYPLIFIKRLRLTARSQKGRTDFYGSAIPILGILFHHFAIATLSTAHMFFVV
jgi:hypothetical protein